MDTMRPLAFILLVFAAAQGFAQSTPAASVASQYSLSTSTTIPFPKKTLDNSGTQTFITSNWGLSKGRIQNGASNLVFVDDPFPDSPAPGGSSVSGPVLQVQYQAGSFQDNKGGGAQMYALWNSSGSPFQSMMISYEVAFDAGFDWVKGGKLPGIRGGPDPNNCSGGNQANGTNCFSSRLMWRTDGVGEVYAYVLRPKNLNICGESGVQCNDQFGISLNRGSFTFSRGQWNRVTLLVRLNSPTNTADGQVTLYFNDAQALQHNDIYFRSSDVITTGGMYFSTFFGGDDMSWASSNLTHTYFRNFQLFASTSPSDLQGSQVKNAAERRVRMSLAGLAVVAYSVLSVLII
ncbi:polysaccharide lyase family 14 protein [Lactifluus subvellereus]|nr:polysaccharide lyase family 14 protein [Lactifluus subvellereus]